MVALPDGLVTTPWAMRVTARQRAGTVRARSLPRGHLGPSRAKIATSPCFAGLVPRVKDDTGLQFVLW